MNNEQEFRIVNYGIKMMKVIAEIHGPEKGMELWTSIADTLGPEIKGKIFFAMLNGIPETCPITIYKTDQIVNKISLIKTVRDLDHSRPGLVEAKRLVEDLLDRKQAIVLHVDIDKYSMAVLNLKNAGCYIQ